jgi:hypothetical protein
MVAALVSPMLATNTAFAVVFGVFVVAFVVLIVLTIRWAVRHDMAGWKIWRKEQEEAARAAGTLPPDGPPARPRGGRPRT